DEEIEKIVIKQMEVGLKSITDGEFRRAWWHLDFLSRLHGVEEFEAEYVSSFKGAKTKNKAIKVLDKVKFDGHYMLDHFKFLKEAVQKHGDGTQMPKFSIPSPNMLFTRIQAMSIIMLIKMLFLMIQYKPTRTQFKHFMMLDAGIYSWMIHHGL